MTRQFPSISRDDRDRIAYELNTEDERFQAYRNPVARWAYEYQTYGDGLNKHAHPYAVQPDNLVDFLFSFAAYLETLPLEQQTSILESLRFYWPDHHSDEKIAAAAAVRYDEKQQYRYYHLREYRTSKASSKSDSKSWARIPAWADGSIAAIVGLFYSENSYPRPLMDRISAYSQVEEYLRRQGVLVPYNYLQKTLEVDDYAPLAVETMDALMRAHKSRNRAAQLLENYRASIERKREQASTTQEVA